MDKVRKRLELPLRPQQTLELLLVILAFGLLGYYLIDFNIKDPFRFGNPIRSDGDGYHIWVVALRLADFSMCQFSDFLSSSQSIAVKNESTGVCGIKYPPGVGLFQFPFAAWFANGDLSAGYSRGQHLVVSWLGAALTFLTAVFGYLTLRRVDVSAGRAVVAVAAFILGAGVFHYGTFDASFSHIYTAFGSAAALFLVITSSKNGWNPLTLCLLFAMLFWLYTIRQTNGLAIVVLYAYAIWLSAPQYRWRLTLVAIAALSSGTALQIGINHYVTGDWTVSSYGSEGFTTWPPAVGSVIASSSGGLIVYYPIFLLVSLLILATRPNFAALGFLFLTIGCIGIYSLWHAPLLAAGFGHRGFVDIAPFGTLALGLCLAQLSRKIFVMAAVLSGLCVFISLQIMSAYWHRTYPFSGASYQLYIDHLTRAPLSVYSGDMAPYTAEELRALELSFVGFITKESDPSNAVARIRLSNTGSLEIDALNNLATKISISWRFSVDDSSDAEGWDTRLDWPFKIGAGESSEFEIELGEVPAGAEMLQVSFVQEGRFWAHDIGIEPLSVNLPKFR